MIIHGRPEESSCVKKRGYHSHLCQVKVILENCLRHTVALEGAEDVVAFENRAKSHRVQSQELEAENVAQDCGVVGGGFESVCGALEGWRERLCSQEIIVFNLKATRSYQRLLFVLEILTVFSKGVKTFKLCRVGLSSC